jgi:hypothetical protein
MRAAGWVFEGNGLTGAYACVPSSPPAPATAEGRWKGSTTDGGSIFGIVLDTGDYYLLYYYPPTNNLAGFFHGNGSSVAGAFSSPHAFDFRFAGVTLPTGLNGSYVAKSTFSATSTASATGFNATYVFSYDSPPTLDAYAGTYFSPPSAMLTLDAQGGITGSAPSLTCTFVGTAVPHGGVAVLNVTLAFSGLGCTIANTTMKGSAFFYDDAHTRLMLVVTDPTNGYFYYLGTKPVP